MININNYNYDEWNIFVNNIYNEDIIHHILHLIFTLDVIEYKGKLYYTTDSLSYKNKVSDIFRYLSRISNYITYNKLYDIFIAKHNQNIEFETNFNTMLKEGPLQKPKRVTKPKEEKAKTEDKRVTWVKYETNDLFTGNKQYIYENRKTGETITSDNPNMLEELKSRKTNKKQPKEILFTFNFVKK